METDYRVKQKGNGIAVFKEDSIVSQGFWNEDIALHSIWVINGSKPEDFYSLDGEVVIKTTSNP